jgi:ribosomal protein L21
MVGEKVGAPTVAGAKVLGSIVKQARGPHLIVFKKRRRKNSRRKRGYRHDFTVIRITEILTDGQKPSKVAKPRPAPKAKAVPAEGEEAKAAPKAKAPAKKAAAKKPAKAAAKKAEKPAAKGGKGKKK